MTPRIVSGMPADIYRSDPAVSNSELKELDRSPMHANYYRMHGRVETGAMRLGTYFHAELLQPGSWRDLVAVKPAGMHFGRKEGKEWKLEVEQQGKQIITSEDLEAIEGMVASVRAHPKCQTIFRAGWEEVSMFATDPETGLQLKGRADWLPKGNCLCDVKTTKSVAPVSFSKDAANLSYHMQAAYYLHLARLVGLNRSVFVFVAVEKRAPYPVCVYTLDQAALELGHEKFRRLLRLHKTCTDSGQWPGPPDKVLSLPNWAFYSGQEEADEAEAEDDATVSIAA